METSGNMKDNYIIKWIHEVMGKVIRTSEFEFYYAE